MWDDHEIANNNWRDGADNHNADEGDFHTRRDAALAEGKGVAVLDGRIVENLHVETARARLKLAEAIAARAG